MDNIKKTKPVRSFTGIKWRTNKSNKERLAIDFGNKCGYCDDHHDYSGGYSTFHVEHFAPKEKFSELLFVYDNLIYSCPFCNNFKSDKWVGKNQNENIVNDEGFVDPCSDDYFNHLIRNSKGEIIPKTKVGEYMINQLKLYLKRHSIAYNLEKIKIRIELIGKLIEGKESKGEDAKDLKDLRFRLYETFFTYYDSLIKGRSSNLK